MAVPVFLFILMVAIGFLKLPFSFIEEQGGGSRAVSENVNLAAHDLRQDHARGHLARRQVRRARKRDADGQSLWVRHVQRRARVRVAGLPRLIRPVTFAPDGDSVYYLTLDPDNGELRGTACPCWAARRAWRLTTRSVRFLPRRESDHICQVGSRPESPHGGER